jgi:hypothetical protein
MRALGLALLFLLGMLIALVIAPFIFLYSLYRGKRAFHPSGTTCRAEITALDTVVGPRLDGAARLRLSGATADENSPSKNILGMSIKLGTDQDLLIASFESFWKAKEGTRNTDITDYLQNEYASVSPWRVRGLGIVWFRAIPHPDARSAAKTGTRVERLEADIAAGRASFSLEARKRPFPDGALIAKLAEIKIVERLPEDDRRHRMSMFRTGRGLVPTGFRNGIRSIVYPTSQLARRLRGG